MSATLTPNIIVGKAVAVLIGSTELYCTGGNVARKVNPVKVTNARSGGYGQYKAGIKEATASLSLVYNGDSPPSASIVEGAEVTVVVDTVGYETSEGIANPGSGGTPTTPTGRLITMQMLITGITDTWQTDGDYGYSVDLQSTGAYTVVETATGATSST